MMIYAVAPNTVAYFRRAAANLNNLSQYPGLAPPQLQQIRRQVVKMTRHFSAPFIRKIYAMQFSKRITPEVFKHAF
jgi:hypothetical protein